MTQQATILSEPAVCASQPVHQVLHAGFARKTLAVAASDDRRPRRTTVGPDDTDQRLVERVVGGDNRAFDVLMSKYQTRLIAVIRRYVKDPTDALDIAQSAFLRAYRAIANFRGDCGFYSWLCRIAINCANSHLASRARHSVFTEDIEDAERYGQHPQLEDHRTPERHLLTAETTNAVMNVIDGLPSHLRLATKLRDVDGLSYAEIARIVDCPLGTVRSRISRARQETKERLELALGTAA